MSHRIFAVVLTCCFVAGVAHAGDQLLNIPLKWTPKESIGGMGPLDLSGPLLAVKIHVDAFVDARQDSSSVGENREKSQPRPVTTSSDVPGFVADHMKEAMRGLGLTVVDGDGDVRLSGELRQFFVAETSVYHGDLSLLMHLKDAAGKEIWSGIILGSAEHFGRSYKADNYYETMSDMVLHATYNLLANPGFHEALAKR
ncbi:MAG TPA: hypothetical protein VK437_10595 [Steroidobacteraceae bacterium]|nr:hypothetical protein [Steroidobacteraceae bacterium]